MSLEADVLLFADLKKGMKMERDFAIDVIVEIVYLVVFRYWCLKEKKLWSKIWKFFAQSARDHHPDFRFKLKRIGLEEVCVKAKFSNMGQIVIAIMQNWKITFTISTKLKNHMILTIGSWKIVISIIDNRKIAISIFEKS